MVLLDSMMLKKIKNHISGNTGFLIRLDDVAENMKWELMEKAEILFDKFDVKPLRFKETFVSSNKPR